MFRNISESYRKHSTVNGVCYGLDQPGTIVRNEGILIRKDWLDKLGLKVPKTTDEFFEVMKAFTFKDPDGNGKNDTYGLGAYIELKSINFEIGVKNKNPERPGAVFEFGHSFVNTSGLGDLVACSSPFLLFFKYVA